jgi:hypothetical protein
MSDERAVAQRANRSRRIADQLTAVEPDLPIEELYRRYPQEWVAIRVTALNTQHAIARGAVIAHSPARDDLSASIVQAHRENPNVRTYVFRGGPIAFSLDELPRLIEETETQQPDGWE